MMHNITCTRSAGELACVHMRISCDEPQRLLPIDLHANVPDHIILYIINLFIDIEKSLYYCCGAFVCVLPTAIINIHQSPQSPSPLMHRIIKLAFPPSPLYHTQGNVYSKHAFSEYIRGEICEKIFTYLLY